MDACGLEDGIKVLGKLGVTVVEQEAGMSHGSVLGGQVASELF